MNEYLLFSSLLNGAGTALLGVSVIVAGRRNPRNLLFALFLFSIAVWSGFYVAWRLSPDPVWALRWCEALMAVAVVIPVTLLHFVTRLTGEPRPLVVLLGYLMSVVLVGANLLGLVVGGIESTTDYGFWPRAGPFFSVALVFFAIFTVLTLWVVARQCFGVATPVVRQRRYILMAMLVGFVGGATNFPLWYGIPIPPVGNGLVLVYTAMMAHAILKYRLPEVSIDLAKGIVYSGLVLTLAVFYVVVYATGAYVVGGAFTSLDLLRHFFASLALSGAFLWLAPKLKTEAGRLMEQTLFKGRYVHRTQLRELANRIFTIADEDRVFTESAAVIARALQIENVAIFFHGELQSGFTRRAALGYAGAEAIPASLPNPHPLVLLLQAQKTTVVCQSEGVQTGPASATIEALRTEFGFEALVPILGHQTLLGFLMLGRPRRDGFFDDLDLSLVETIAFQIGLAVRSRQLERKANQTESLISLGTLAAGLAHELRNPLVSIKTFSSLLKEHGNDPEFQQGFLQVMDRDVTRIGAIVESVAAFAESHQVAFAAVDLREVLRSVDEITADERGTAAVELTWPQAAPAVVQGNFGQLVQVFLNLVQNAMHALEDRTAPRIEVAWREEQAGPNRWLRVELEDNGRGIDPLVAPRIFDPFFTTKATGGNGARRGMGLGLAIVKRIIDGHRGQIGVDSQPGKGTRFTVLLPVPETAPEPVV